MRTEYGVLRTAYYVLRTEYCVLRSTAFCVLRKDKVVHVQVSVKRPFGGTLWWSLRIESLVEHSLQDPLTVEKVMPDNVSPKTSLRTLETQYAIHVHVRINTQFTGNTCTRCTQIRSCSIRSCVWRLLTLMGLNPACLPRLCISIVHLVSLV